MITIHMGPELDTLGLSAIQELACFDRLREVRISEIEDPAAFQAVATKPNLTSLDVAVPRHGATGPQWVGPTTLAVSVHGLRQLSMRGNATVLSSLFKVVRFHALKSAVVEHYSPEDSQVTPADVTAFLAVFYNAVSDGDVQSFQLTVDIGARGFGLHGHSEPVLRDLLAPILPIRGLRYFRLFTQAKTAIARLDDPDIRALATAWPRLERLSIENAKFTSESSVSLNALHHLSTHCPHLQQLFIFRLRWPIIGVHAILPPLDWVHSPAHPLWDVSVLTSGPDLSDEGAEALAGHLLDLFPNLDPRRYKCAADRYRHSLGYTWNKVLEHVYSIRSARNGL
ncbi:hypothetical protein V8D89_007507 [Ganoderma adspersum]